MALETYADLKSAVADWLERADLDARIPDFIRLAESRINRMMDVRTVESDAALTGVPGSRFIPLPTGFREAETLWLLRSGAVRREPLRATMPELMSSDTVPRVPVSWCVDGSNIAFECPCDQAYSFVLRMLSELRLSDTVTTNLILQNYPDLYLFGACLEAGPFLRDNDLLTIFDTRFQAALAEAKNKEFRAKALTTLSTEPGQLTNYGRRPGYNVYSDQ